MPRPEIVMVPLADVRPWPRNPKRHADDDLRRSIRRFGFTAPLIVNANTEQLVAGHGRLEALIALREAGEEPPARIEANGGDWRVPVLRVPFRDENEAAAYALADNRLTEKGGWDMDELCAVLADLGSVTDLDGIGWNPGEVEAMMPNFDPVDEDTQGRLDQKAQVECPECGHRFTP